MNFVSYSQLQQDIQSWATQGLPRDIVAVAGIPRSGLLPALHLALHRNLHLVSLEELAAGQKPWHEPLRRGVPAKRDGRVLVLDDSVYTGGTLRKVRSQLPKSLPLVFGAVYFIKPLPGVADVTFRQIPAPRCFQWNLFHCQQMCGSCLDMDGVLCQDWTGHEESRGPNLEAYRRHVAGAAPLHLPTYKPLAIVTSRLERWRRETQDWLARHGVQYGELVMSPHKTPEARRAAGDHAQRKAGYYASRPDARLFVESDARQAQRIAQLAQKPVLCTDNMTLHRP